MENEELMLAIQAQILEVVKRAGLNGVSLSPNLTTFDFDSAQGALKALQDIMQAINNQSFCLTDGMQPGVNC